jgi:hypothetical protein
MKIKNGYGSKELKIRVGKCGGESRSAELWIEFGCIPKEETLSYLSLDELLDLKEEIQETINEIVGVIK